MRAGEVRAVEAGRAPQSEASTSDAALRTLSAFLGHGAVAAELLGSSTGGGTGDSGDSPLPFLLSLLSLLRQSLFSLGRGVKQPLKENSKVQSSEYRR